MNILVLSWRDPKHPMAGGAEQVMHEHMKGWVRAGHKVTFFSSKPEGVASIEQVDGIEIIRKGSQYITVHAFAFFWYLFGKHKKFDLVVDQFHGWPFFTPLYVGVSKLAVIQETTREVWLKYPLPLGLNYILGPIGYFVEPIFFFFYKKTPFLVGSLSAKKELIEMGIEPPMIHVIEHGVILHKPKKEVKREERLTLIFLGALAKDKGVEDAIRVFGLLKREVSQFWIVGRGSTKYLTTLKQKVRSEGIESETKFWGFVSDEKKFELLGRAHVMINPSIREGWGLVNIEANAMGTPVVAYPSPGLVDSVVDGKNGIICKNSSPEEMANQVKLLINSRKRLEKLSKSAIEWSSRFSWETSSEKSVELIEKLTR